MPYSRYRRRALLPRERLVPTARDLEIFRAVHRHRFIRAHHLHPLAFPGRTLRAAQSRLEKLWQHGYLDRYFVPYALDGTRRAPSDAATPVYTLGPKALEVLKAADSDVGGRMAMREVAPSTLAHHLVVTDLLASIEAACLARGMPENAETEHEWRLWKTAGDRKVPTSGLVVPDGAVTFRGPDRPVPETWYVEVVRADVAGGNDEFLAKMRRYLALRDEGRFLRAFGHVRVRGVFIATPTPERARNLRALCARLPSDHRFFAFTHFEERQGDRRIPRFRPETVLDLGWTDGAGGVVRIGRPGERSASPADTPGAAPSSERAA